MRTSSFGIKGAIVAGVLGALLATTISAGPLPPAKQRVVLVFPIEFRGIELGEAERQALADYLGNRLGEGGYFNIVPRESLHRLLTEQKAESYKACYDQACQIELGRELAAQLTVATQIGRVGSTCLASIALYDLRKAATVATATARTACGPDDLVSAIDRLAKRILEQVQKAPAPRLQAGPPPASRVDVQIDSTPAGASVFVDGKPAGFTPVRLQLPARSTCVVAVRKDDYEPVEKTIMPIENERIHFNLKISGEEQARLELERDEWIGFDFQVGYQYGGVSVGANMRFFVLKWRYLFWAILESQVSQLLSQTKESFVMLAGTRVGFPLYLGRLKRHQLRFGLGMGVCLLSLREGDTSTSNDSLCLVPSIRYVWQTGGWFHVGVGLRVLLPVQLGVSDMPLLLYLSFPMGWTEST